MFLATKVAETFTASSFYQHTIELSPADKDEVQNGDFASLCFYTHCFMRFNNDREMFPD